MAISSHGASASLSSRPRSAVRLKSSSIAFGLLVPPGTRALADACLSWRATARPRAWGRRLLAVEEEFHTIRMARP